jgi:hypothetical protein
MPGTVALVEPSNRKSTREPEGLAGPSKPPRMGDVRPLGILEIIFGGDPAAPIRVGYRVDAQSSELEQQLLNHLGRCPSA